MKKKAIVLGASGSAGSYQVDFLRQMGGYDIYPLGRQECDLSKIDDLFRLRTLFLNYQPDEVYNWAGRSYVPDSWHDPYGYMNVNGSAVGWMLHYLQEVCPKVKFFQASSAEIFEKAALYQYEDTNRLPNNPYGLSKNVALEWVRIYREKYGLFGCTGILYNMESHKRPTSYFAEKVCWEAAKLGRDILVTGRLPTPERRIQLRDLSAVRDWGLAEEYVEAAWRMLQYTEPTDYCIATGASYDCKAFVAAALTAAGVPDVDKNFDTCVEYTYTKGWTPNRDWMVCRSEKLKNFLGWQPKTSMEGVVKNLVKHYQTEEVLA